MQLPLYHFRREFNKEMLEEIEENIERARHKTDNRKRGQNRHMRQIRKNGLHLAIRSGVKVVFGSDAGTSCNLHGNNAMDLVLWVNEGLMGSLEAICSGTRVAAEALGIDARVGTVEKGKTADFIAVEGDLRKEPGATAEQYLHGLQRGTKNSMIVPEKLEGAYFWIQVIPSSNG